MVKTKKPKHGGYKGKHPDSKHDAKRYFAEKQATKSKTMSKPRLICAISEKLDAHSHMEAAKHPIPQKNELLRI